MIVVNLKSLRIARNMTQTRLAEQVSVSPAMISRLESGQRLPSFSLACRLALALSVAVDDLTTEPYKGTRDAA
jgi:transcriptional regulator with XRE-family HTH domain